MHFKSTILMGTLLVAGCSQDLDQRAEEKLQEVGRLPTQEILFVDDHKVPCNGTAPAECLRVRSNQEKQRQLFYGPITGFNFEPGYRYELLVMVNKVESPPQDVSDLAYELIKVIGKTPTEPRSASQEN